MNEELVLSTLALSILIDKFGVECGNCGSHLVVFGGSLGEHNGLTINEIGSEEEQICGYCAGQEIVELRSQLATAVKERDLAVLSRGAMQDAHSIRQDECYQSGYRNAEGKHNEEITTLRARVATAECDSVRMSYLCRRGYTLTPTPVNCNSIFLRDEVDAAIVAQEGNNAVAR